MSRPDPFATCPAPEFSRTRVVLTDIDDTLTTDGTLLPIAYQALARLREAGLIVVPVTGRPAGWCDLIARQWPVDAVVGENGAFYFRYDTAKRSMRRCYAKDAEQRRRDRERLALVERDVLREVRGAAVAADQAYREADLAIDFSEDVSPLGPEPVARIVTIFERHGAKAKVSSIHVNGWFGGYDKLTTSRWLLRDEFQIDVDTAPALATFVGDSPNDQPMFEFFPNAVGVANVGRFLEQLRPPPRWITRAPFGAGFAEFADTLLNLRDNLG